jgi:nucleoside-diphosphate-sugar epimerase
MVVAITGATGFIGKHLVRMHLALGDEVRILTRKTKTDFPPAVRIFNHGLLDGKQFLADFLDGADVLYHCAAEIKDASKMQEVNVEGTKNLIDAAKGKIKHWVQLSSTGVYGPVFSGIVSEKSLPNPNNAYEVSKYESDLLVIAAGAENLFTYAILRPSNVFGADMSNQSLFQLVKTVDRQLYFFIGKPGANANYVPVENVAHAMILLANDPRAKGKIFNISDLLPLERFIGIIAETLNKPMPKLRIPLTLMNFFGRLGDLLPKSPITTGRVKALTSKVTYDNSFLEKELDYAPIVNVEDSLRKLVQKYQADQQ